MVMLPLPLCRADTHGESDQLEGLWVADQGEPVDQANMEQPSVKSGSSTGTQFLYLPWVLLKLAQWIWSLKFIEMEEFIYTRLH